MYHFVHLNNYTSWIILQPKCSINPRHFVQLDWLINHIILHNWMTRHQYTEKYFWIVDCERDLFFIVSWRKFRWTLIGFVFAGLAYYTDMMTYTTIEVASDHAISIQTNCDFATWRGGNHWHLLSNSEVIGDKLWINAEPCIRWRVLMFLIIGNHIIKNHWSWISTWLYIENNFLDPEIQTRFIFKRI